MDGFKNLLRFYCLLVSTLLLFVAPFFLTQKIGFTLFAVFLPFAVYFWLKTSSPGKTSAAQWSFRLLLIVLGLSALGIWAFWLALRPAPVKKVTVAPINFSSPTGSPSGVGSDKDLKQIKDDLAEIKAMLSIKGYSLGIETETTPKPW